MPYPDNFNSAAFDAQFADDDAVTREDASRWHDGVMDRTAKELTAWIEAVRADYTLYLGKDAPALTLRPTVIMDTLRELIDDDVEWGQFDDRN